MTMFRLPLNELEEAVRSPAGYRERIMQERAGSFGSTFFTALRDAIFKFHSSGDDIYSAGEYLAIRLDRFSNESRKQDTMEQLEWYVTDYTSRDLHAFVWRHNIVVPLPDRVIQPLTISGQIGRIDMRQPSGYAAWIFQSSGPENWYNELRMPLIQDVVARRLLNVSNDEVTIGIYGFHERYVDYRSYSEEDIRNARDKLDELLQQLGF